MTREQIIARIVKCEALSHSDNQHEAVSALLIKERLIEKYKIQPEEYQPLLLSDYKLSLLFESNYIWKRDLAYNIASLYGCTGMEKEKFTFQPSKVGLEKVKKELDQPNLDPLLLEKLRLKEKRLQSMYDKKVERAKRQSTRLIYIYGKKNAISNTVEKIYYILDKIQVDIEEEEKVIRELYNKKKTRLNYATYMRLDSFGIGLVYGIYLDLKERDICSSSSVLPAESKLTLTPVDMAYKEVEEKVDIDEYFFQKGFCRSKRYHFCL